MRDAKCCHRNCGNNSRKSVGIFKVPEGRSHGMQRSGSRDYSGGPGASLKVLKKIFVDLVCQQCNVMSIFFGSARVSGLYYIIRILWANVLFFCNFYHRPY